jgi:hypothetical protein
VNLSKPSEQSIVVDEHGEPVAMTREHILRHIAAAQQNLARMALLAPDTIESRGIVYATAATAEATIAAAESLDQLVALMREFVTALTDPTTTEQEQS